MRSDPIKRKVKDHIICAAIWYKDDKPYLHQPINIDKGFVICGFNHHNCFATAYIFERQIPLDCYGEVQGFITASHKFVNREEAAIIAYKDNQIANPTTQLYSEYLYESITFDKNYQFVSGIDPLNLNDKS